MSTAAAPLPLKELFPENLLHASATFAFASGVKFTIIVMLNTSKFNNEQVRNELVKIVEMQNKSNGSIMVGCTSRK